VKIKPSNISKILGQVSDVLPPKSAAIVSAPNLASKVPESLSLHQIPPDVLRANFAPNIEDALPRIRKHFANVYEELPEEYLIPFGEYKQKGSHYINKYLREGDDSIKDDLVFLSSAIDIEYLKDSFIPRMDKVFNQSRMPEDITVYRGISARIGDMISTVGDIFVDKGYSSTSYRKSAAQHFGFGDLSEIKVPKGISFVDIASLLKKFPYFRDNEDELILNRGTRFAVDYVDKTEDNYRLFHMRVLPQE